MQADELDQRVDLRRGTAEPDAAADPAEPPRDHCEVQHQRRVGERQPGEVDDEVRLQRECPRQGASAQRLRDPVLITTATQDRGVFLQFDDPKADIHLYINSPGGSITAGMAIYDTMQYISCDVATYCIGQAASMGAILLTAGAPGKRNALPNARIMIHQPLAGMEGTATELEIHAKEVLRIKARMNDILLKHTGQTLNKIEDDTDRDNFMSAEEAKHYNLIDNVLERLTKT